MKKITSLLVLALIAIPFFTFAAELKSGDQITIGKDETISQNFYVAGSSLNIAGHVTGDLIAAGGDITVTGPVDKDATLAGGNIMIDSNIGDDLRVAGGQINIKGNVNGDLVVAGGKVHILPGTTVGGDLIGAGGQIINDGTVKGKVLLRLPKEKKNEPKFNPAIGLGVWWFVKTLMALVTGLVIYSFLRPGTREIFKKGLNNFWQEVLRGFAFMVLAPIALIITFITIVGIPLSLFGLFAYIAIMIIASVFGAIILGGVVAKYGFKKPETLTAGVIFGGIVFYQILKLIPFVGWIIVLFFFLAGLGSLVHLLYKQTILKWRE